MSVSTPFKIVRAAACHADRIAQMESLYIDCSWNLEQVKAEIQKPDAAFFVAVTDTDVIGYLSGECGGDECELSNIAVETAYRRRGVARALFDEFLTELRERGIKKVFLLVDSANTGAIALYSVLGFIRTGIRRNYYAHHGDALIMRKDI